ncbi:M48 family metallopeptidase [Defluviimonas sp. WL0024]|uniref:M48 family metallopeptidase n=1 Tax=Albidovulum salinarum TaxID=2984153 RepID=A0ABT2X3D1_9RHOB|nr:M48 family metallopeptidase [Defluviimonas sp. WL0024]MCU9848451.1 M48 family metallopeptidase [Defluviimonas sp. WL0024]
MTGPEGPVEAAFFDGMTARRWAARIAPARDGLSLVILREGAAPLSWRFDRLRALADQSDATRLTLTVLAETEDEAPRDPARLVVTDPAAVAWLLRTRPGLMRRDLRAGTFRKVALWLGGAVAAVVMMLYVILPGLADYLAERLPRETEVAFGRSVMRQVEWIVSDESGADLACTDAEGLAALDAMKARLVGERDLGYEIELRVFDHEMVNAFAAPGGQVVIFRGLIDEAESAEEVAAVLGHEIGHVVARDPIRLTLRAAGSAGILSLILGDVTGGTVIAAAGEHVLQTSYTREAETAADAFAYRLLNEAGISSEPMAGFFDRIAKMTDLLPEYLSSHPLSAGRAEAARVNAAAQTATAPVLNAAEWQALRGICKD